MRSVQIYVLLDQGEWMVRYCDKNHGPYDTEALAIRAAIDAADSSGRMGHEAQVLVQDKDNQFHTEWTYGKDPYPPAG